MFVIVNLKVTVTVIGWFLSVVGEGVGFIIFSQVGGGIVFGFY